MPNGFAGPARRKLKKAAQASQTPIAAGWYSTYWPRVNQTAMAMYAPRTKPQKRSDPSSYDQRLTMVTQVGTAREPTCAT